MTGRDRIVVVVVVFLLAVIGSWMLVIQPKRDQASKLGGQVTSAQSQLDSERAQVVAGEAAKSTYAASYTELARLGEAVPADDDVSSLIYQLQGAAGASRVDFRSLLLSPSGAPAPAPAPTTGSAAQSSTATLPPGVAVGPAGFPVEPFTFTFNGNFFHLANFLGRLQRFVTATERRVSVRGRLMTLNAISLGPGSAGFPQITATISATTYLVPASQGVTGTAPAAAAGTPASASSSSTPAPTAAVTAP
jgi:hypothetical protein